MQTEHLQPKERISVFRTGAKQIFEAAIVGGPGLGNLAHDEWETIAAGFSYVDPAVLGGKVLCISLCSYFPKSHFNSRSQSEMRNGPTRIRW